MGLFESGYRRTHLRGQFLGFAAWFAVTVVGAFLQPDPSGHGTHTQLGLPPCPSAYLFSRPCPGCGMTTSWTATIHGDFATAFAAHPMGPIMYLAFTAYAMFALVGWLRGQRFNTDHHVFTRSLMAIALLFLGFGVVRAAVVSEYRAAPEGRYMWLQVKSQP